MKFQKNRVTALVGSTLLATTFAASAVTLRIANQGDALSLDPHSLNESLQLTVLNNIYEPLVVRGRDYKLAPALAPPDSSSVRNRLGSVSSSGCQPWRMLNHFLAFTMRSAVA